MQVSLLRVLQERKVTPVGSNQEIPVDIRIITATHRDLRQLVSEGKFREDLYYRLHVYPVHVPAFAKKERRYSTSDAILLSKECLEYEFSQGISR